MAYDDELAARVRHTLDDLLGEDARPRAEKAMFGGLAFLIDGSMALAVSGAGGIMVKVGPGSAAALVATTPAAPVEMGARVMRGWVRLHPEHLDSDDDLAAWVARGLAAIQE